MFLFASKPEFLLPTRGQSGPLLELEQQANEFLAEKSASAESHAVDLVHLYRDEIRRASLRKRTR